jgi:hypothetical protein
MKRPTRVQGCRANRGTERLWEPERAVQKKLLEILASKPEMVDRFPSWMLPPARKRALRKDRGLAIVEVAGRDSVAAALAAAREGRIRTLLPTVAYTGTEHGSWQTPFDKIALLRKKLASSGVRMMPPLVMGWPELWRRLCGRPMTRLIETYGFYSPCIACHLYFHALRIPLARLTGCTLLIGGERESHDGRIKINQIGPALDVYAEFTAGFGVELLLPLRRVSSGREVEALIGEPWDEGRDQLGCVLSGNYRGAETSTFSGESTARFLRDFAVPEAADAIGSRLR